jgi:hypothetical protein
VTSPEAWAELDPFDLPEWVGEDEVAWVAEHGLSGHLVAGCLTGGSGEKLPCDLLAVDHAYPVPVVDETTRTRVHQSWRHGQVLLLSHDERATVAVPGTSFAADRVLEAFTRVARAVGADSGRWSVRLTLS